MTSEKVKILSNLRDIARDYIGEYYDYSFNFDTFSKEGRTLDAISIVIAAEIQNAVNKNRNDLSLIEPVLLPLIDDEEYLTLTILGQKKESGSGREYYKYSTNLDDLIKGAGDIETSKKDSAKLYEITSGILDGVINNITTSDEYRRYCGCSGVNGFGDEEINRIETYLSKELNSALIGSNKDYVKGTTIKLNEESLNEINDRVVIYDDGLSKSDKRVFFDIFRNGDFTSTHIKKFMPEIQKDFYENLVANEKSVSSIKLD